ncbi:DUF6326 family protein [Homoserinimonas sp. OAct 916]|uniref:DUF6326 family protein n=1 Tax=Homoserinimonas sp. OAct 916 TaxID=2211450 RepID=UPI000DBE118D|nr:DUF6326 family protein [Homoserinimonas sp. OAct 916]
MTNASLPLAPLDARIRLAALWTATMLIVAFVDIFGFYRHDIREQIEAGRVLDFEIDQVFMLAIVAYVIVPTLMIVLCTLLPYQANRITNLVVALIFAVTIVGAAIGEWGYYLFASAVELGLLAAIVTLALRWTVPATQASPASLAPASV